MALQSTRSSAVFSSVTSRIVMMTRLASIAAPPRHVPFRVDRPFLLLVRHRASGALYFLARVTDPR